MGECREYASREAGEIGRASLNPARAIHAVARADRMCLRLRASSAVTICRQSHCSIPVPSPNMGMKSGQWLVNALVVEVSTMADLSLDQRVATLEQQMASILGQTGNGSRKKDWRRTVGRFTDDPGMQALFADAQKIRDADRK